MTLCKVQFQRKRVLTFIYHIYQLNENAWSIVVHYVIFSEDVHGVVFD